MKFKTIDTMEKIAVAVRDGDQRALEEVLANVNAASRLADNWPFDPGALKLLLFALLQQLFDHDQGLDNHKFQRAEEDINYVPPVRGFQFNVATILADLAKMAWEKSIPGMERLILEMVAAGGLVRGESIEPIDPFIHVGEAVIRALKRKQA